MLSWENMPNLFLQAAPPQIKKPFIMFTARIIANVILLLLIFVAPWWVVLICAAGATLYFERYYEILIAGLCMDALFGAPFAPLYGIQFIFLGATALILLLIELVKPRLRIFVH